jgi:hypothetical protein
LLEECVSESASQEKTFDNVLLQVQGKCGFLSLPWGDHFFSSGYLWNHKLYSLLPNAEKQRDSQQQKQENNSVPEMEPKQLAYFSAQDSRQHNNNNNNNNKRSARNGNCSKAKANRRQAQCVLPRDIPHYHSTTFQRRRRYA